MHETMVAQSIVDTVSKEAAEIGAKPIGVKISCGQLNPINDEIINFALDVVGKGTVCEGMKLEVVHIPLKSICKKCGKSYDFKLDSAGCPDCQSTEFNLSPDAPLLLEEIEFEDE